MESNTPLSHEFQPNTEEGERESMPLDEVTDRDTELDRLLNIQHLPPQLRPLTFKEGILRRPLTVDDLVGHDVMAEVYRKEATNRLEARRSVRRRNVTTQSIRRSQF